MNDKKIQTNIIKLTHKMQGFVEITILKNKEFHHPNLGRDLRQIAAFCVEFNFIRNACTSRNTWFLHKKCLFF